jgi:hypothetical protein
MEAVRESWTDARLTDFVAHTDARFDAVDRRFDQVEADLRALRIETKTEFVAVRSEMNMRFERIEGRIDDLHRTMLQLGGGAIATIVAGFVGVIATQL